MSTDQEKRSSRALWPAGASLLLGGLATASAAWGGAWIGSHGAAAVQRDQAHEARRIDARGKRAAAYERFFAAINASAVPSVRVAERCAERRCSFAYWQRMVGDRNEALRRAYDQVALYGSFRGYAAAGRLVGTLPAQVWFKRELTRPNGGDLTTEFEGAYQEFVRTMCEEVNAEPRPSCSKLRLPAPPTLMLTKPATEASERLRGGVVTIYR
jgi:hypothetical protein